MEPQSTVEGDVIVKKRDRWSKRYVKIEDSHLFCKKTKGDPRECTIIDLRRAKIKYSREDQNEEEGSSEYQEYRSFISVESRSENVVIAFETVSMYNQWRSCISRMARS